MSRRVPVQLQSELADCGLACLAMVRSALGCWTEVAELRSRHGASIRGSALKDLIAIAHSLALIPRPVKCGLDQVKDLALPCVLHWDFNHFVVLEKATARAIEIVDPAIGRRRIPMGEASAHFTGIALELRPGPGFQRHERPRGNGWSLLSITTGWRAAAWHLIAVSAALEAFGLAVPLFTQVALDNVVTSSDADLLTLMVIGFGLVLLAQSAVSVARGLAICRIGHEMKLQWTTYLFHHVIRLPVAVLESRTLGDFISRFRSVEHIQRLFATSAVEATMDGLTSVVLLVLMWMYSPGLTAIVALSCAAYTGIRWASHHWFRENTSRRLMLAAREQSFFVETFRAMVPIKLFGGEARRAQRWQNIFAPLLALETGAQQGEVFYRQAGRLLAGAENLAVLGFGVAMVLRAGPQPFTVGMLMAFLAWRVQFSARVAAFADFVAEARLLKLHDDRLAELLALEREPLPQGDAIEGIDFAIELRDVGFRYGASGAWVFRHCNLRIRPCEHLVLVGPSGGGKTTLLKIILGLLQPTEGEVLVGGRPVTQLGSASYRSLFGAVMQDDALVAGSVTDNVAFESDTPDEARVEECCRLAQVHADIAKMPMAYRSLVGDLGASFSGGQRQRIMIARALYKRPRILAFDEATSHLDVATEIVLARELDALAITRISVAHRPETIRRANRLIEVAGGGCRELPGFDVPPACDPGDRLTLA